MSKATAADRLSATRAELEAIDKQVAELVTSAPPHILVDDDRAAAKLFTEIEKLKALAAGYTDKVALLEQELEREAEAKCEREREARLRKFEEVRPAPKHWAPACRKPRKILKRSSA